jgi:DNA-binding MarR family transcriptional regulator
MLVIKNFIDEFYNKTLFRDGQKRDTDLAPTFIKSLFAFIDEDREYPIGELGANAKVKSSTMTDMVDRMEREGIAERVRDDGDRRVVKVRLTARGKKMKKEFYQKRRTEFEELFAQLTAAEIRDFIAHLDEAYKILQKIK